MKSSFLDLIPKTRRGEDPAIIPSPKEFVVQKNGLVRQAGATLGDEKWVKAFRTRAERHLYVFVKSVLNRAYLTKELHLPVCEFLQRTPPRRKNVQMFRGAGKSSIMVHGLPLHIHIQPKEANCYFPGEDGREQRGIIIGEALPPISKHFSTVRETCESNELMRALWPNHFWPVPPRRHWNDTELRLPRSKDNPWPDDTFRCVGVGQAVTGAHPSWFAKDDLVTIEAANSMTVMQSAIEYHVVSRAMIDNNPKAQEFISGTRWGMYDFYSYIEDNDPSVEIYKKALVEEDADGKPFITYPAFVTPDGKEHGFTWEKIEQLKKEHGSMYPLLYLNKADDPSLVEFHADQLRAYTIEDGKLTFEEDDRDLYLADLRVQAKEHFPKATYLGQPFTPGVQAEMFKRRQDHVRLVI